MKYTTIFLEETKIEIFNSILGKETIKVNDEIVSAKYSIFGATHHFSVKQNEEISQYQLSIGIGIHGIVYDLYKDGKPIIESAKGGCLSTFITMLAVGVIIGILFGLVF